jgi:RNA polymerase sigma factor (sigma-70 family)
VSVVRRVGLPVEQLSDEMLLTGFTAGDEDITVAFVRRFQSKVFGVALAVLRDTGAAQDVAQQAFERAWRQGHTYDPRRGAVAAWLTTITRNAAIDAARVRRPLPVDAHELLSRVADTADSPERAALAGDSDEYLRAALRQLPAEQARAVVLAGIGGLSASQVADSEGIPLGTAKTRIRTAMLRLRDALTQAGVDRD